MQPTSDSSDADSDYGDVPPPFLVQPDGVLLHVDVRERHFWRKWRWFTNEQNPSIRYFLLEKQQLVSGECERAEDGRILLRVDGGYDVGTEAPLYVYLNNDTKETLMFAVVALSQADRATVMEHAPGVCSDEYVEQDLSAGAPPYLVMPKGVLLRIDVLQPGRYASQFTSPDLPNVRYLVLEKHMLLPGGVREA